MMKFLLVLIIAVVIFVLVYLSSDGNKTKAAICAALAAAIAFAGPYIVNLAETKEQNAETTQENVDGDDTATDSNSHDTSGSEEKITPPTHTDPQYL